MTTYIDQETAFELLADCERLFEAVSEKNDLISDLLSTLHSIKAALPAHYTAAQMAIEAIARAEGDIKQVAAVAGAEQGKSRHRDLEPSSSPDPIREEMASIVQGFLECPEIADCAPEDKDQETDDLERRARTALSLHRGK